MRIWRLLALGIACWASAPCMAQYDCPQYLVVPPAQGFGYTTVSPAPRYAYGWFGAAPRYHASRHFGYYRDYTQWTRK